MPVSKFCHMNLRQFVKYWLWRDTTHHGEFAALRRLMTPDFPRIVVDVGANDGFYGSNSFPFVARGWRSILVEPHPKVFAKLQKLHRFQTQCDLPESRVRGKIRDFSVARRQGRRGPQHFNIVGRPGTFEPAHQRHDHGASRAFDGCSGRATNSAGLWPADRGRGGHGPGSPARAGFLPLAPAHHHHGGLYAEVSGQSGIAQQERLPASNADSRKFNLDRKPNHWVTRCLSAPPATPDARARPSRCRSGIQSCDAPVHPN